MKRPKIFIGYDKNERISAYTLAHSIQRNASGLVDITFLDKNKINGYKRPRHELDSTDFSISRFAVPYICGYKGYAIFMDCDCVVLGDIYDLWRLKESDDPALWCVHQKFYTPKEEVKFLGNIQTCYSFKNWSSVMLFNNEKCTNLTLEALNNINLSGLYFHTFRWLSARAVIGTIPPEWNILIGVHDIPDNPKLLHYTSGGPYFRQYKNCETAGIWIEEFKDLAYATDGWVNEKIR